MARSHCGARSAHLAGIVAGSRSQAADAAAIPGILPPVRGCRADRPYWPRRLPRRRRPAPRAFAGAGGTDPCFPRNPRHWHAMSNYRNRWPHRAFDNWTLHAHAEDFSESMDLCRQHPQKLAELVAAFDDAAWANMVYPLDNRTPAGKFLESPPHQRPPAESRLRFLPNGQTVHRGVIA